MPSSSDSIVAPMVAEMPRSLQNATRCCCGIDMVTQHRNDAKASIANTTLAFQPNTFGRVPPAAMRAALVRQFGRRAQERDRQRQDHHELENREADHGPAPAEDTRSTRSKMVGQTKPAR